MNSPKTLFELLPVDLEEYILSYVDDSKYITIEKYLHRKCFKKSLFYINRQNLEKYIKSKLKDTYSATYKFSVGKNYCLACFHFPMFKDGSLMTTNGRTNKLCFRAYCRYDKMFLDMDSIKYHCVYNNFTKKQRQKLWLLSKILLTTESWEK